MELREALTMARQLAREHGLDDWSVVLDRARTRAGACHFGRRRISLSRHLTALHTQEEVRQTVLHEIAHALVGPRHGHDAVWRAQARAIGCTGERCMPADAARVPGAWVGTCPAGHQSSRHRRPERVVTCGQCSRRFDLAHLLDWTHNGRPAPMPPGYVAQLAALRSQQQRGGRDATGAAVDAGAPSLRRGDLVRVTAPGSYLGAVGRVEKRARTRYHVRIPQGLLAVPFALVQPVGEPPHPEHPDHPQHPQHPGTRNLM